MGRDRSRSRERRGDRDRDEKGRGGDRRDDRGDDRRDSRRDDRGGDKRDDRGGDKRDDRGDERRRERSGERRRERSGERAPASGKQYKTEEELMQLAKPEKKEDKDRDREGKDRDRPSKKEEVEEKDDDEYRVGRQVMVRGLQKNPEKNGSIGQLVEFNKEKGRWVVAMGGGNNNFKEENLELMADNSDVVDENQEPPTAKVYITKLSAEVTAKDLLVLFGGCGLIEKEPPKSGPKGFRDTWPDAVKLYKPGRDGGDACVTYMDGQSAKAAIKCFHRYKFKGSKIGVAYAGEGKTYEKTTELQKPWFMREENQGKLDREGGGGGGKDGGKSGPKPGDWKCEGCGADVFASKDSCFKCGSPKPAGGGGSSGGKDGGKGGDKGGKDGGKDGGKGGGKAGDWTCPGCAANVFASKDSCFKCGESRPGGGGGGGGKGGGRW